MRQIEQKYGIVGGSKVIKELLIMIEQVASSDISILIYGESGVGKELVAQALHDLSFRKHEKYVIVNCGAIPSGTIESELFGHKKGSFTGAVDDRKGFFETADKGTILLDEIGDLPLETQVKLLRTLEQGEITRVGESIPRKVNVRVLAATNRDLSKEVSNGKFRQDLFFRLKTIILNIPALRERKEDIPMLAEFFMMRYADDKNLAYKPITPAAMNLIENAKWEGNIRELKNFIQSVFVLEQDKKIQASTVSLHLGEDQNPISYDTRYPVHVNKDAAVVERELILRQLFMIRQDIEDIKNKLSEMDPNGKVVADRFRDISKMLIENQQDEIQAEVNQKERTMQEIERDTIEQTLDKFYGSKRKTAQALGMSERTLYRKINEYGLKS
ncbi:MAG: sigma-54 dependent transcriptional regulator [Candidatus Neomarinimicrobiota bacterium]